MAEENVEAVRDAWDAWLRADLSGLFTYFDPNVVWDMENWRDWPERAYHGREGVRRFLEEWLATWDAYEAGADEFLSAPDGRVVVLSWQRGRGHASGLAMEMKWAQLCTVRDGKLIRVSNYDDRAKALRAAGLER